VARRGSVRLRGGDWQIGRPFGCLDSGRSEFGLDAGSVLYGEISLSLQKVDVCPSLGDNMGDEGWVGHERYGGK
jgi:hypothetical protein